MGTKAKSPEGAENQGDSVLDMLDKKETTTERPAETRRVDNTPWEPAKVLDVPAHLKDPNYVYRWVNKEKPGNIRKKLSEGWEIDEKLAKKLDVELPKTIQDGSSVDSSHNVRELILMRLPKERKEARQKYFDSLIRTTKDVEDSLKENTGGTSYGKAEEK